MKQVGRNERINYAKGLLQREFLPHVGIGAGTEAKKVRRPTHGRGPPPTAAVRPSVRACGVAAAATAAAVPSLRRPYTIEPYTVDHRVGCPPAIVLLLGRSLALAVDHREEGLPLLFAVAPPTAPALSVCCPPPLYLSPLLWLAEFCCGF